MKKILIKSFSALAATVLATGCIQETFPQGSMQIKDQVSKSEGALEAMVNAIPAAMMISGAGGYANTYGWHGDFGIPAIHICTENMLEDLATQAENPYWNRFYFYSQNIGMDSRSWPISYFWDCYYAWIKAANDVISLIDPEDATPEAVHYLGMAYTYRAMYYLDLARMYEPKEVDRSEFPSYDISSVKGLTVPIITEKTSEKDANNNPRVTRQVLYNDLILADLANAEKYLADYKGTYTTPGLYAVYGLMARAYLEMGYWEEADSREMFGKAASYADKVLKESGKSPLTQAQWEDPATGFNSGASNSSWIWGLTLSSEAAVGFYTFTGHMSTEAIWGYGGLAHYGISKRLYERIPESDFRKHSWLSPEFIEDPESPDVYQYKFAGSEKDKENFLNGNTEVQQEAAFPYQSLKFRPAQGEVTDEAVGNLADHVLMRIEEMYFIKAEALAQTGDLAGGVNALAELIKTRNPQYSYTASDTEAFLDELLLQKRIEFWGEGILYYDYKRLGAGITRGYEGTNHPQVWSFNTTGRNPQWNFVISRGEFQANTGINPDTDNNPDPSNLLKAWK